MRAFCQRRFLLYAAVILTGCGTLSPPPEYTDLKMRLSASAAAEPVYDVARDQLHAAEDALARHDGEAARRLSVLGLIEARIAETQLLQIALAEATEQELQQQEVLQKDVSLWQSRVTQLLAEQARQEMRTHIEAVIEKETLAAAATEELQAGASEVTDEPLHSARRKVALELIGMAKVRLGVASLMAMDRSVQPEQLNGLKGAVALMETALADDDIASVYQFGEESLAQFVSVVDDAWTASGTASQEPMDALIDALHRKGFNVTPELVGPAVSVELPGGGLHRALTPTLKTLLSRLADILFSNEKLAVLVVVSSGAKNRANLKQAADCCGMVREEMAGLNIRETQYSILQLSHERPLRVMTGKGMQMALVFVPRP